MPHQELTTVLRSSKIAANFTAFFGHPPTKVAVLRRELSARKLQPQRCVLVGDSGADFEAAQSTGLMFIQVSREGSPASVSEQKSKAITVANLKNMEQAMPSVMARRFTSSSGL
jgi:phosphoglycolate phosphatase-like HAD superfamily hydrolase